MNSPLPHLIAASIMLLISVGGYFAWYSAVAQKSVHVAEMTRLIELKQKTAAHTEVPAASLVEIAEAEREILSHFASREQAMEFVLNLKRRGTDLATAEVEKNAISLDNFHVRLTGSFDGIMRTMAALEQGPYVLQVSSLDLTQFEGGVWRAEGIVRVAVPRTASHSAP